VTHAAASFVRTIPLVGAAGTLMPRTSSEAHAMTSAHPTRDAASCREAHVALGVDSFPVVHCDRGARLPILRRRPLDPVQRRAHRRLSRVSWCAREGQLHVTGGVVRRRGWRGGWRRPGGAWRRVREPNAVGVHVTVTLGITGGERAQLRASPIWARPLRVLGIAVVQSLPGLCAHAASRSKWWSRWWSSRR